jgi:hypothetical protein
MVCSIFSVLCTMYYEVLVSPTTPIWRVLRALPHSHDKIRPHRVTGTHNCTMCRAVSYEHHTHHITLCRLSMSRFAFRFVSALTAGGLARPVLPRRHLHRHTRTAIRPSGTEEEHSRYTGRYTCRPSFVFRKSLRILRGACPTFLFCFGYSDPSDPSAFLFSLIGLRRLDFCSSLVTTRR